MELSKHLQQLLTDNGLTEKVQVILAAIQRRQMNLINNPTPTPSNALLLTPEEVSDTFPSVSADQYPQLEKLVCRVLNTEIKRLLQTVLKPFVGKSLKILLKFLSEKILKGKMIQFAHSTLEGKRASNQ